MHAEDEASGREAADVAALGAALDERERQLAASERQLAASQRQTESAVNQLRDAQFTLDRAEVCPLSAFFYKNP
jgi:hypothetical protein